MVDSHDIDFDFVAYLKHFSGMVDAMPSELGDMNQTIRTTKIDKGTEIPIIYKMKASQAKWLIYDMKIENVSLVLAKQ